MKNFLFLGTLLLSTSAISQESSTNNSKQEEPKQVQKEQISKENKIPKRVKVIRPATNGSSVAPKESKKLNKHQ